MDGVFEKAVVLKKMRFLEGRGFEKPVVFCEKRRGFERTGF